MNPIQIPRCKCGWAAVPLLDKDLFLDYGCRNKECPRYVPYPRTEEVNMPKNDPTAQIKGPFYVKRLKRSQSCEDLNKGADRPGDFFGVFIRQFSHDSSHYKMRQDALIWGGGSSDPKAGRERAQDLADNLNKAWEKFYNGEPTERKVEEPAETGQESREACPVTPN